MQDDAYAALLKSIGDASFRREVWDDVLDSLASAAGARGVAIIPLRGNTLGLRQTASLDALADTYVSKGWATRDYRYRGLPKMLAGQVSVDADFVDYDTLRHEPFYEDFLRPLGFRHFAGIGVRNGDDAWAVTLQRAVDDEPFSLEEQSRLASLVDPLQGAIKVGQALADAYHQGTLDRLDVEATACVLIDRLGLVAHMNRAAEAMLGTTLDVRQGFIRLKTRDLTSGLHTRIQRALSPLPPIEKAPPSLVHRGPGGILVFEVLRLPDMDVDAFGRYRCMLLIHRAGGRNPLNIEIFRSLFALSRQEAVLADALSRSSSLVEAARELQISHETARSQLKSIFGKTGARSQAELLTLIGDLRLVGR